MPTHDSASYLVSTVESVLAQTFENWEVVLSDDGSTDSTVEVARDLVGRDERIVAVQGRRMGPAVARNAGLHGSDPRSEFVVFLDSDDTWEPKALDVLVRALAAEPDCVAAYGLARATDMDGHQFEDDDLPNSMRHRIVLRAGRYVELPAESRTPFDAMLLKNSVVTPGTTLIRRRALAAVGDLDPAMSPADDWDLLLRLARQGDFILIDDVILNWRRHSNSLANTSNWSWAVLSVARGAIASRENTSCQRSAAAKALLDRCRTSRRDALRDLRQGNLRAAFKGILFTFVGYGTCGVSYVRSSRKLRRLPS
jgi:glycosyltransferase involved in cell wall biosynthesis